MLRYALRAALVAAIVAIVPLTARAETSTLGALGESVVLPLSGWGGARVTLGAGCVCTASQDFSFDGGTAYAPNVTYVLPLVGNSTSGSVDVPTGATHARVRLSAYTSGSTAVTLVNAPLAGNPRALASGTLSAATADGTSQTGNFVALPIDPTRWASALISLNSAAFTTNNLTAIWDVMINGKWQAAPPATLQGATNTVAASVVYNTINAIADVWDVPILDGVTAVRVRTSVVNTGTITPTLTPGRPRGPAVWHSTLFSVSGTYVPRTSTVTVTLVGGGGQGGGGYDAGGGAGGGSASCTYGPAQIPVTPGSPLTVTVGAGGTGAGTHGAPGANGGNGGLTSVTGALIPVPIPAFGIGGIAGAVANGGAGGASQNATPGGPVAGATGGTAGVGGSGGTSGFATLASWPFTIPPGGAGGASSAATTGGTGRSYVGNLVFGGAGTAGGGSGSGSTHGAGGAGGNAGAAGNAPAAGNYGGGGGGGSAGFNGGDGSGGVVIIAELF